MLQLYIGLPTPVQGFIVEKDAEGCFQLLLKLHPQATALEEEEARLFYSKALTLCLECEPPVGPRLPPS